jgi:hypothetical protein
MDLSIEITYEEIVVSDHTDLGGDIERDYVHRCEVFTDFESAFKRFRELVESGVCFVTMCQ